MILLITNKEDITVDYVVRELKKRNTSYYRLNTEDIPGNICIDFNFSKDTFLLYDLVKECTVDLEDVTSVYFRRPRISNLDHIEGINDTERLYLRQETAQILEAIYKILEKRFWINNVYRIREAENKVYQLRLAKQIEFLTPDAILSNSPESVRGFMDRHDKDCVIKPVRSGAIGGDAKKVVFTSRIADIPRDEQIRVSPLYLQNRIKKDADLRITTIGERVYCARIDSQIDEMAETDWRRAKGILKHTEQDLPGDVKEKCLEITSRLGLVYSAIDLIQTCDGEYVFLECNPNGQWAWIEERLGFPISQDIVGLLENA